jgi:hypothetical protein
MTGIVHANCPNCGVVECRASEVTIRCYAEAMQNTYRFQCPECLSWIARTAGPAVVTLLLRSGAQVETTRLPQESGERSVDPAPISDDDLIDIHQALAQWSTFQRQTGGISE